VPGIARVLEPDAEPEEILEAEQVEPAGETFNDTPQKIKKLMESGASDRKART
jgi:hypothetical protein